MNEDEKDYDAQDVVNFLKSIGWKGEVKDIGPEEAKEEEEVYINMTGHENTVNDYTVEFTFKSAGTVSDVRDFIEEVVGKLFPLGTSYKLVKESTFMNLEDLTFQQVGSKVKLDVHGRTVEGTLNAIYPTGGSDYARTLIIDGQTWTLTFGVVQVN